MLTYAVRWGFTLLAKIFCVFIVLFRYIFTTHTASGYVAVFGEPGDAALRCAASCLVCDYVLMCVWGKHSQ